MSNQLIFGRALDANGYIAPGAKARVTQSGTDTLIAIYSDKEGTIAAANPVVADGDGVFPQRYANVAAKVAYTTASDETLYTQDPAPAVPATGSGASDVGFTPTVDVPATNVQDAIELVADTRFINVRSFGAVGDGVADDTAAFTAAGSSASPVQVRVPPGIYRLNTSPFTVGDFPSGQRTWIIEAGASFVGAGKLDNRIIWQGEQPDWYGTFEMAAGRDFKNTDYTNFYVQTTETPTNLIAGLFAAQTLHGTLVRDHTAIFGVAANNNATLATRAWGGYFEATKTVATTGATYAAEIDPVSSVAAPEITPYGMVAGQVIGIQMASGAELDLLTPEDTSAAINIANGLSRFRKGIVFQSDSLTGATGTSGSATAIALGFGHSLDWYYSGGIRTARITSFATTAAGAAELQFHQEFTRFEVNTNKIGLQINHTGAVVNGLVVNTGTAGNAVGLIPEGDDTNIDLLLSPKGSGNIRFGSYTASPLSPVGFITIKDSGGTSRRLLVG